MGAMKELAIRSHGSSIKMKEFFFDRAPVISAMDKKSRRVLSRFGSYVRRTAKGLIRPSRKLRNAEMPPEQLKEYRATGIRPRASSRPGEPPRNVTGLLKRFLFFCWDPRQKSVVIGPEEMGPKSADALEYGGSAVFTGPGPNKGKLIHMEARPFMGPAYEKEEPKLPGLWADSVK